ncbi:MAG: histidinol-phosphate transaminase [Firmicutes bacterium]|nr:histidinol-phosphate transaminase [Bacillota bacterium]
MNKNILNLKKYETDNYRYKYKLNANESPFNIDQELLEKIALGFKCINFNRYPDPDALMLRKELSNYIKTDYENIMVGNGSDELISIIINSFLSENDLILTHGPTFSMYQILTKVKGSKFLEIPFKNLDIDIDKIIEAANKNKAKMIILCSHNNPTGAVISKSDILKVLTNTNAYVLVDEAYIEFGGDSVVDEIYNYDNLIVLRTLSKAFGLAGIRLGYLVSSKDIVDILLRVKAPYNVNRISQYVAIELIKNREEINNKINIIINEREKLFKELKDIDGLYVYPSKGNFLLIKTNKSKYVFEKLLENKILVRNFNSSLLKDCLRITVGSSKENKILINVLRDVMK